ncbi:hypothetical protein BOX15_Mlig023467g1 [Macrostomum lignano]|uniref:Carbonic anhydrase n=1 Tax=Macrostomum lignano TaxID=282301 RepID=A0A267EWT4_9PLAT|nr:hypothetical protein BOX15_Mlig023467g3 [Macrostomum lignano]PAA69068.1 hypothetical protein BOX15_Mlig023467g1 [Macrostomum lignano]
MSMLMKFTGLLGLLLLVQLPGGKSAPTDWDYVSNDPSEWPSAFKKWCGGRAQSPIKLIYSEARYDTDLPPYSIVEDNTPGRKFKVYNDGHKVSIFFSSAMMNVTVPGHPNSCFRPHSIHWHWGADDSHGSEHWMEGRHYPLEGHVVMWNCQFYSKFEDAANSFSGLAVLGILYEPDSSVTTYSGPLANMISLVASDPRLQRCAGCANETFEPPKVDMDAFPLGDLVPADRSQYYLYGGSLTTPDCRQNVMWTVYRQAQRVPPSVLATLRSLKYPDGSAMISNFRPPVPLNPTSPFGARRIVVRSFNSGSTPGLPRGASWLRADKLNSVGLSLAVAMTVARAAV